ncbi:MAG TPA: vWA domain-containing protein [Polyangiaceae bacterium]|nr:vWA domain-containing protein [Polyangiaceae bacterium]
MRRLIWLSFGLLAGAFSCSGPDHLPPIEGLSGGGGGSAVMDAGLDVEPGDALLGICGQEIIPALTDLPNLYFILDRSGSMSDAFQDSSVSKYETARDLLGDVLRQIGHRVRYGAAVFPALSNPDGCGPGVQVFPTTQGDAPSYARDGQTGPILSDLLSRLGYAEQEGGTPTAATLEALRPILADLGARTYVVLATDGAPNCNDQATCSAASCMLNIEHASVDGTACEGSYNCCDPASAGSGANAWCVDGDALEQQVSALTELGITTYVIGMPGAEIYADLLDRLAELGGTAQAGASAYFAADDTQSLSDALFAIGTGVAISCSISLEHAPEDPAQVNVYFDETLVPLDAADGWDWSGTQAFEVHGTACEQLKSGAVLEVQVAYGCPTVVR